MSSRRLVIGHSARIPYGDCGPHPPWKQEERVPPLVLLQGPLRFRRGGLLVLRSREPACTSSYERVPNAPDAPDDTVRNSRRSSRPAADGGGSLPYADHPGNRCAGRGGRPLARIEFAWHGRLRPGPRRAASCARNVSASTRMPGPNWGGLRSLPPPSGLPSISRQGGKIRSDTPLLFPQR